MDRKKIHSRIKNVTPNTGIKRMADAPAYAQSVGRKTNER